MFRLKRNALFTVLLLLMAMAVAACGGNGDDDNGNGGSASNGGGSQSAQSGGQTIQISMVSGFRFSPDTVTIPPGTTVRWVNQDRTEHNVVQATEEEISTDTLDPEFQSDQLAENGTFEWTFNEVGEYDYLCTVGNHYLFGMTGKIIVQEGASVPSDLIVN